MPNDEGKKSTKKKYWSNEWMNWKINSYYFEDSIVKDLLNIDEAHWGIFRILSKPIVRATNRINFDILGTF